MQNNKGSQKRNGTINPSFSLTKHLIIPFFIQYTYTGPPQSFSLTGWFAFKTVFNHCYCFHESFIHSQIIDTAVQVSSCLGEGKGIINGVLSSSTKLTGNPQSSRTLSSMLPSHFPTHTTDGLFHPVHMRSQCLN